MTRMNLEPENITKQNSKRDNMKVRSDSQHPYNKEDFLQNLAIIEKGTFFLFESFFS